ncbi:MAG: hypothetical protein R2706_09050 [Acidimicrobiales bacterium]
MAIAALDLYQGPLLPDDLYTDYVNQKRRLMVAEMRLAYAYLASHHRLLQAGSPMPVAASCPKNRRHGRPPLRSPPVP